MLGCASHYYKFPAYITRAINSKYYGNPCYYIYKYNFNTVFKIGTLDGKILTISEVGQLLVNSIPFKVTNLSYETYVLPNIKKINDKLVSYIIPCEEYDIVEYDIFGNNISHYILTSYKKMKHYQRLLINLNSIIMEFLFIMTKLLFQSMYL